MLDILNKFGLHRHKWYTKKWRWVHIGGEPLSIIVGVECSICGKRKIFHLLRNVEWEEKFGDKFDSSL